MDAFVKVNLTKLVLQFRYLGEQVFLVVPLLINQNRNSKEPNAPLDTLDMCSNVLSASPGYDFYELLRFANRVKGPR